MHRPEPTPILKIDLTSSSSMYSHQNSLDPSLLLQRIEFLELSNTELKRREQYLKMINATLLEALGNKDTVKEVIGRLGEEEYCCQTEGSIGRTGYAVAEKQNESKRKFTERRRETEELGSEGEESHRNQYNMLYESGAQGRAPSSKDYQKNHQKNRKQHQIQIDCNSSFKRYKPLTTSNYSSSKQKFFSKNKSPDFVERIQFQSRTSTPKISNSAFKNNKDVSGRKLNNANNDQVRKSMMQTMVIDNCYSKVKTKQMDCSGSTQTKNSQGSETSHSMRKSRKSPSKRNIATALLCDLCGESFTPLEFMSHANQCQSAFGEESDVDKSFDEMESESEDLLETLEQEKAALLNQIHKLKKDRKREEKNTQKNLDQIVFVINGKKGLNERDLKSLMREKNSYLNSSTARRR